MQIAIFLQMQFSSEYPIKGTTKVLLWNILTLQAVGKVYGLFSLKMTPNTLPISLHLGAIKRQQNRNDRVMHLFMLLDVSTRRAVRLFLCMSS